MKMNQKLKVKRKKINKDIFVRSKAGEEEDPMEQGESQWLLTSEEFLSLSTFKKSNDLEESLYTYRATGLIQTLGMRLKL